MHLRHHLPLYLFALSNILHLAVALTTWESIHQTIHTYPLAIDTKDFDLLSKVFAPDAFANYTGPLSNLTGLPAIQSALTASVANINSQHLLGTTLIDIHCDGTSANSTTYFSANLFGKHYSVGQELYIYGYYADALKRRNEGWRIESRQLLYLGPGMVGNSSIIGS